MSGKLINLHYLRGIASLLVVFLHYNFILPDYAQKYFSSGGVGVDTFFVISGFIITYATQKKESVSEFAIKRFFRIYPLFMVIWLIASITVYSAVPWKDLIKSLMLFHNDYNFRNAPAYGFNLMGTPWTLTYEVYFYSIFCFAIAVSQRHRVAICSLLIVSMVALLQIYFNHKFSLDSHVSANLYVSKWWMVPIKILSTTILFEFIAGMLLAQLFIKSKMKPGNAIVTGTLILSSIVIISVASFINLAVVGLFGCMWIAVPLVLSAVTLDKAGKFFKSRLLNNAGNISYSLYLVHFPVMVYSRGFYFDKASLSDSQRLLCYMVMIVLSYILANITHYAIEKPAMKLARNITKRLSLSVKQELKAS
jgi:exopolysaccharide production protein ExoZ